MVVLSGLFGSPVLFFLKVRVPLCSVSCPPRSRCLEVVLLVIRSSFVIFRRRRMGNERCVPRGHAFASCLISIKATQWGRLADKDAFSFCFR